MSNAMPVRSAVEARPLRVLVVDDDPFSIEMLQDRLGDLGVTQVATARSGADGLRALDRPGGPLDLVLCDLHMPETDGFMFMERLAERRYAGAVAVVSGMDARTLNSAALMARFHRLNIVAALPKPVTEAALRDVLGKLVGGRSHAHR